MKEKLLKTPQGAESIFMEEAYKHLKINEEINDIYTRWGFLPIKTPVFDYYETYEKLLSQNSKKNCFRLMDRDGELLLLRNDITLFLARQLGRVLHNDNRSFRVHYSDSILRHQSEIDISSNEFFQTGAEIVGVPGLNGDLEAITLLHNIIYKLDIPSTKIHIGSRAILDKIVETLTIDSSEKLLELINLRDERSLAKFFENYTNSNLAISITKLFLFIGTVSEFKSFISNNSAIKELKIKDEANYLKEIGETLDSLNLADDIRFDLSEVASRDYYTGIVFKAYTKNIDSAIASGGRYDDLIKTFGKSVPSVGFSILLRKVEPIITDNRFYPPKAQDVNLGSSFKDAYIKAEKLRSAGKAAVLKEDN